MQNKLMQKILVGSLCLFSSACGSDDESIIKDFIFDVTGHIAEHCPDDSLTTWDQFCKLIEGIFAYISWLFSSCQSKQGSFTGCCFFGHGSKNDTGKEIAAWNMHAC